MKKKIGVWIPHGEIWEEFTDLVKDKWGKKHSVLGLELEEAIKMYIAFGNKRVDMSEETITVRDLVEIVNIKVRRVRTELKRDIKELKREQEQLSALES